MINNSTTRTDTYSKYGSSMSIAMKRQLTRMTNITIMLKNLPISSKDCNTHFTN